MGHRLSKISTRTGDNGTTGLGDGSRVEKDRPRIEALGDIDELNSAIGVVLSHDIPEEIRDCLIDIQHRLFDMGGELSIPGGHPAITGDRVTALESLLERFNAPLPPLREFILPGGNPAAAACHFARSVCRRAERRVIGLAHIETINEFTPAYLNRLSDLLFVIARHLARLTSENEPQWQSGRNPPDQ